MDRAGQRKKIVILGAGFGGAYAAKSFEKLLRHDEADVLVLDRNNYVLFYPLLVEAGVGSIEARHVVVPIRKFIKRGEFRMSEIKGVDFATKQVTYQIPGIDKEQTVHYDQLIIGVGSVTKTPPVTGLAENGFQLKTLSDAIGLRDRGIRLLELASSIDDAEKRRELLTCVVVGANLTGAEFAGEYLAFLQDAAELYPNIKKSEIRMVLIEATDKVLAAVRPKLADWCRKTMEARGIEILTKTTLNEVAIDHVITSDGKNIRTHTVLWAAGVSPNPSLSTMPGLPINDKGYVDCESDLRVKGFEDVWCIGDIATVKGDDGKPYSATAQTASREGPAVARNIVATFRGEGTKPFAYMPLGTFAAIGRRQAAAEVLGLNVTGFLGWIMYRATYLAKIPTLGMKLRLLADWTTEIVFKNEPVQLGVHALRNFERSRSTTSTNSGSYVS